MDRQPRGGGFCGGPPGRGGPMVVVRGGPHRGSRVGFMGGGGDMYGRRGPRCGGMMCGGPPGRGGRGMPPRGGGPVGGGGPGGPPHSGGVGNRRGYGGGGMTSCRPNESFRGRGGPLRGRGHFNNIHHEGVFNFCRGSSPGRRGRGVMGRSGRGRGYQRGRHSGPPPSGAVKRGAPSGGPPMQAKRGRFDNAPPSDGHHQPPPMSYEGYDSALYDQGASGGGYGTASPPGAEYSSYNKVSRMELLLPEIAEMIAQHLTPRDLSACCSVSTYWRQVFGRDQVWKRWCDPGLEEHLRTTPCVVQPAFSVPGERDSTLAPLSRWRTAFLREQHLWSNWRHGRVKTVDYKVARDKADKCHFVTDDFFICSYSQSIELWNVKVIPPICTNTLIFNEAIFKEAIFIKPVVYNNNLVTITYQQYIEIHKIDVIESTLTMKYIIFYDTVKGQPVLVEQVSDKPWVDQPSPTCLYAGITPRNKCIVYDVATDEGNVSFHIWDLNSGKKLKEEPSPFPIIQQFPCFRYVKPSETCEDMLVLSHSVKFGKNVECRVYNVEQLHFLPFSQMVDFGSCYEFSKLCAIIKNFVAIFDHNIGVEAIIRIFNYQTGQQLYLSTICGSIYGDPFVNVINKSCFVFQKYSSEMKRKVLCFFECPSGTIFEALADLRCFKVIGKNFVHFGDSGRFSSDVFKINKSSTFKIPLKLPPFSACIKVNQACTRLAISSMKQTTISHFW